MSAPVEQTPVNRLIHESSPYLQQHAHNPVDWYAWGAEALARARAADRPILLSVGYSACHWCHVMAHESFEDPETAALMNELFVCVKVDREERPDVDAIYMDAVQAMTGSGGWPLTVFLTPDGKPFFGGTYFPPSARQGMPAFRQVLQAVADAWRDRRGELESASGRIAEALTQHIAVEPGKGAAVALDDALLAAAKEALLATLDPIEGGFGRAPKFPQPMNLDFLLQTHYGTHDEESLRAVTLTLKKMAHGGIYDHLGGGFHRYSTDAAWLVPHFEKMLYDNALLARTYLHAWQVTGDGDFRRVVEETLDYVLREMTSPEGGFYSSQDADSEGQEGRFFTWTPAEISAALGDEAGALVTAYYEVTPGGNFREGGGRSVLHATPDPAALARAHGMSAEDLLQTVARGREQLLAVRRARPAPGRDEKVLAEWNGLMIAALAEAGAALDRPDYVEAAVKAAQFLVERMTITGNDGSPRLFRAYKDGQAYQWGYLEDYAAVALGLVTVYQATLDARWLRYATAVPRILLQLFFDSDKGGFFETSAEHEQLLVRRKDLLDNAIPSGNALAVELFLRLGHYRAREDYQGYATGTLQLVASAMQQQPGAFGRMLCALGLYLHPGFEIAVIGDPAGQATRRLLAEVWTRYLPTSILALAGPNNEEALEFAPFLRDRGQQDGCPTAYVCRNYTCNLPVTDAAALAAQLTTAEARRG